MRLLFPLLIFLTGCTVMIPGTSWEPRNFIGPKSANGSNSQVMWRCESGIHYMSNGGPCYIGFKVHDGNTIELNDVRNEVDEFMWNSDALRSWVAPPDHKGRWTKPWNSSARFPYQLHLLTISPTVILAVPIRSDDNRDRCHITNYQSGCYSGHRFSAEPLQTNSSPRFVAGSFWFAPSLDMDIHEIPQGVNHFTIDLPTSHLELDAHSGIWSIERRVK